VDPGVGKVAIVKNPSPRLLVLVFILLFILGIFLMSRLQEVLRGTTLTLGVDIYPRWVGAQAALRGESPYGLETRRAIWNAIYGSPDTPSGNPFGFYYPPSIVTLLAPSIILGISAAWAAVLGCAALWALWGTFVFLWFTKTRENSILVAAFLLLSGLVFRPAFSNYVLGQSALFSVIAAWAAWVCLRRGWNVTAGVCLALALVKPSTSLLPVVLLFALSYRIKNLVLSFLVANLVLFIPPTILLGWWVPDFLADIARYSLENQTAWNASHIWTVPGIVNLTASGTLLARGWLRKDTLLMLASTFALNSLFVPHTADYDLIVFILPILWMYEQLPRTSRMLLTLTALWLPWISLVFFSRIRAGGRVEDWYPLIWNFYPSFLLLAAAGIAIRQGKQPLPDTIGQP
jgi:hypothetical protein